jgi:hypothetical protein
MRYIQIPSSIRAVTVDALCRMGQKSGNDASLSTFFSFGGDGAGINISPFPWKFKSTLQFWAWIRVETFEKHDQHILTLTTESHTGIDIFFNGNVLTVTSQYDERGSSKQIISATGVNFVPKKWYHLMVTHTKSRFGSDEIVAVANGKEVLKGSLPFVRDIKTDLTSRVVGRDFNGQMGPVGLAYEAVDIKTIQSIARNVISSSSYWIMYSDGSETIGDKLCLYLHPRRTMGKKIISVTQNSKKAASV